MFVWVWGWVFESQFHFLLAFLFEPQCPQLQRLVGILLTFQESYEL